MIAEVYVLSYQQYPSHGRTKNAYHCTSECILMDRMISELTNLFSAVETCMKTLSPSVWVSCFVLEPSNVNGPQLQLIFIVGICRVNPLAIILLMPLARSQTKGACLRWWDIILANMSLRLYTISIRTGVEYFLLLLGSNKELVKVSVTFPAYRADEKERTQIS